MLGRGMKSQAEMQVRNHSAAKEVSDEREQDHGIWVYLVSGYCNGEDCAQGHTSQLCVHSVHEDTWNQCWLKLKNITRCDCATCTENVTPNNA